MLIVVAAVAMSCSAMAQAKMSDTSMHKMSHKSMHNMDSSVMMMDGKMMTMMHGKSVPIKHAMTMKNGTMVMPDGMVKMKGGKTMTLKEGQCVMMDGEVTKMPMKKGMMMKDPKKKMKDTMKM